MEEERGTGEKQDVGVTSKEEGGKVIQKETRRSREMHQKDFTAKMKEKEEGMESEDGRRLIKPDEMKEGQSKKRRTEV